MPILVKVRNRVRRLKKDVVAEWREKPASDSEGQIEDYRQSWGYSPLLWRCPHGVYLPHDPEEIVQSCAVCESHCFVGKPGRGVGSHLWINDSEPGRLNKFPRKGYRSINFSGYVERLEGEPHYFPPDHYVSPYDDRFRCRKTQMAWYFIPGESGDGIGVRAQLAWGESLEGESRFHRQSFTEEEKDDEPTNYGPQFTQGVGWHYEKRDLTRLKAYFFPRYRSIGLSLPPNALMGGSIATFWDDERTAMEWEGQYRRVGGVWTDRKPQQPALPPVTRLFYSEQYENSEQRRLAFLTGREPASRPKNFVPKKGTAHKFLTEAERALDLSGRWWERWNGYSWTASADLSDKDVRRWRAEHWDTRAKYKPPPSRKAWVEGWQNERKMHDLEAKLEMYRYGCRSDGVEPDWFAVDSAAMMQAAWRNPIRSASQSR